MIVETLSAQCCVSVVVSLLITFTLLKTLWMVQSTGDPLQSAVGFESLL